MPRTPSYLSRLPEAVKYAKSYADVFRAIGVTKTVVGSGNYRTLKRWIKKLNLDISHFSRSLPTQSGLKVSTKTKEQFTADNLFNGKAYGTHVRKGIIKHKILPYKCANCSNEGLWCGQHLSLHIDHIDGNDLNNEITNLRFLCPNCHSQTETYAGAKNKKIKPKGVICPKPRKRKVTWPSRDDLIDLLKQLPLVQIAKRYNVTDNAVRKWCENYVIDYKVISPFSHKPRLSSDIPDLQNLDARRAPEEVCHFILT